MPFQAEAVTRAHLILGGFPAGSAAGHDHDFIRLTLTSMLTTELALPVQCTHAMDFDGVEKYLEEEVGTSFLISKHTTNPHDSLIFRDVSERLVVFPAYCAGPFADDEQTAVIESFLERGGRWLSFHGSAGGKAARVLDDEGKTVAREMVKLPVHEAMGVFFLNHPPHRAFTCANVAPTHRLMKDVPPSFDLKDELYILEMLDPNHVPLITTTLDYEAANDPPGFGFAYAPERCNHYTHNPHPT